MDRKKKNLRRKIQIKLDQKQADLELRKEELENAEKLKSLSEKLDEDTSHHDRKIEGIKDRISALESEEKIIKKELENV